MKNLECKMYNYFQFNFSFFAAKKRKQRNELILLLPLQNERNKSQRNVSRISI